MWLLSSGLTASGALILVFLAQLSGRIVSRSTAKAQVDQANHNAAQWQRAAEKQSERADLAVAQTRELLTGLATIEALLRSLSPPAAPPAARGRR